MILISLGSCHHDLSRDKENMMATDRQYSELSEKGGMKAAFLSMFDSSGVLLRRNHLPVVGIQQIKELLGQKEDTSFILSWKPLSGTIASSGDLGYTYGLYEIKQKSTRHTLGEGTYCTIWRKTKDDKWKAVLDTGNPGLSEPTK